MIIERNVIKYSTANAQEAQTQAQLIKDTLTVRQTNTLTEVQENVRCVRLWKLGRVQSADLVAHISNVCRISKQKITWSMAHISEMLYLELPLHFLLSSNFLKYVNQSTLLFSSVSQTYVKMEFKNVHVLLLLNVLCNYCKAERQQIHL